jgi:hypothetical protein
VKAHVRLLAGAACLGAWLGLLLLGYAGGGAVHLLALAGLALVPWRAGASAVQEEER